MIHIANGNNTVTTIKANTNDTIYLDAHQTTLIAINNKTPKPNNCHTPNPNIVSIIFLCQQYPLTQKYNLSIYCSQK